MSEFVMVKRELAEVFTSVDVNLEYRKYRLAVDELRALLAAPFVERQESTHKCQKCYGQGYVPTRQAGEGESEYRARCKLYTSPPAPVSVFDPVLGSTPEDHMRWLLDKVVNPGDYPQAVLHDQIRSTLACLDKVKELNQ